LLKDFFENKNDYKDKDIQKIFENINIFKKIFKKKVFDDFDKKRTIK